MRLQKWKEQEEKEEAVVDSLNNTAWQIQRRRVKVGDVLIKYKADFDEMLGQLTYEVRGRFFIKDHQGIFCYVHEFIDKQARNPPRNSN